MELFLALRNGILSFSYINNIEVMPKKRRTNENNTFNYMYI